MEQFTASEVRRTAAAIEGKQMLVSSMLRAYADRLEADEKAMPVDAVGELAGSAGGFTHAVFEAADVPVGTKLYAYPAPADAERLAEALRELKSIASQLPALATKKDVLVRLERAERIAAKLNSIAAHSAHTPWTEGEKAHFKAAAELVAQREAAQAQPQVDQFDPERNVRPGDIGTEAQPPAAGMPDWTDAQCVAFMATGLRHTEYKKGKSPTVEEIRQGARAALAAQENIND